MPVRKRGGVWVIDGVAGSHQTRREAEQQLRAIKSNKRQKRRE